VSAPTPSAGDATEKSPADSFTETVELVLPGDANPIGTVFGGRVMQWIDLVASMAAQRHCRKIVVTASIDALEFQAPIFVGEYAVLKGWVNRTWRSSLELEVLVDAEHPLTGERRRSSKAFLTFVALDHNGKPTEVPAIRPTTDEEWARWREAEARRAARLALHRRSEAD
jgi:acyl-CoA hydrolase